MEREFQIRTHHLCILEDILPRFFEYSGNRRPWEFTPQRFFEITQFVKKFAEDEIDKDRIMRNYFESSTIEGPEAERDYLYVVDLIGTDNESYQKTFAGRTDFFMKIFEVAHNGKNNKIILSNEPDGYCKSCAIGKHCYKTGPDDQNYDLIYQKAIEDFLKTQEGAFCEASGMLGTNRKGEVFVTAELFFNPNFYAALESRVNAIKLSYEKANSD